MKFTQPGMIEHTVYGIFDDRMKKSESNVTMLRQDAS